jgi:REP element-mobilizing transposase RayT
MPNHVHLILKIEHDINGRIISAPTISTVVGQMKRKISKLAGFDIWQKSFYDHIIRNENDYQQIWQYIDNNPLKWKLDKYYDYIGDGAHDVPKKDVFYETY